MLDNFPTHVFLVAARPADRETPALPGMPSPEDVAAVWAVSLDVYGHGLPVELDQDPEVVLEATAVLGGNPRAGAWTKARRHLVSTLDSMYTTPWWSITWATAAQAQVGRGRWAAHESVLDALADWTRDRALEDLHPMLTDNQRDTLRSTPGSQWETAYTLDAALAETLGDGRNMVGLGWDRSGDQALHAGRTAPVETVSQAKELTEGEWLTWARR